MIDTTVLNKPFVQLYMCLVIRQYRLSELEKRDLDDILNKILAIMPEGKIANKYKEKLLGNKNQFSEHEVLNDILRYMDVDVAQSISKFNSAFYDLRRDHNNNTDISRYISVFKPLINKLFEIKISIDKIISEEINA